MKKRTPKIVVAAAVTIGVSLVILLFALPLGMSVRIYEENFGVRYETYAPMSRSIDEFEGLRSQYYAFQSNKGRTLVGYGYYHGDNSLNDVGEPGAVVIIAHGLGGGGHNVYIAVADHFASKGFAVFAYDATGNDESEGESVYGLPQGIIDLEHAISFVKQTEEYENLPIMIFGHSWGAYSAGSVLNLHPDVKAVAMFAGFDKSIDIILEEGKKIAGDVMVRFTPYLSLYERIKFGDYAALDCASGIEASDAGIMIVHSADDEMLPPEMSYDVFHAQYKDNPRFVFVKYEDRGHDYVFCTDEARLYRAEFNRKFDEYLEDNEFPPELKVAYLEANLDKNALYELDTELLDRVADFYNSYK